MQDRQSRFQRIRAVRFSTNDDIRIASQAELTGLSVSEYIRRTLLGGGPIIARVDLMMVNELRRIGGLLKHNFTTLRQVGASKEIIMEQNSTLKELRKLIELISENYDHQKTTKERNS